MMPIMLYFGSGNPINVMQLDYVNIDWENNVFVPLTLHYYALKRGQLFLDLYPNIIKSGDLVPFLILIFR